MSCRLFSAASRLSLSCEDGHSITGWWTWQGLNLHCLCFGLGKGRYPDRITASCTLRISTIRQFCDCHLTYMPSKPRLSRVPDKEYRLLDDCHTRNRRRAACGASFRTSYNPSDYTANQCPRNIGGPFGGRTRDLQIMSLPL